jgi:hypothetical protein
MVVVARKMQRGRKWVDVMVLVAATLDDYLFY